MSIRLAIFGGTFDPIHNAHLAIARGAVGRFGLDRVLFVPAAHPPHKAGVTHAPYEDRVRMAGLACAGEPRFEVSRLEEGARFYPQAAVLLRSVPGPDRGRRPPWRGRRRFGETN